MNKSLWIDEFKYKPFPKLEEDLETDILIVGGGITGIACGVMLVEEGYKVTIVDAAKILHGTTGHTTAKVTVQHGILYQHLIKRFGLEKATLYAQSNQHAIDLIKKNIKDFAISCDYETVPSYIYTQKDLYIPILEKELDAAQACGIPSFLTRKLDLPFEFKLALGFKEQGHFHVTKYLQGLIERFEKNDDSYIFENSKVVDIKEDNNMCHTFLDNGVKVKSRHVIFASHYPSNKLYNSYFTKLKPSVTYLIAAKYHVPFESGDFISYEKPIRSFRIQKDWLLIAGDNHQTGHSDDRHHFEQLETFGREHFQIEAPEYTWCTQDYITFDHLPYIGRINPSSEHVYVATGFKKWGMTTSHVAARILCDLITNHPNAYTDLYCPQRISDKLNLKFVRYNLHSIKHLIIDHLTIAPMLKELKNDEGKIVTIKGKKYGAYRDEAGELFVVDATCPHLKCILTFNADQKTYDCPCHGSRFTYKGRFIDGPAERDLKRMNFK